MWPAVSLGLLHLHHKDDVGGFRWHVPLIARSPRSLTDSPPCFLHIALPHSSGAEGRGGTGRDVRVVLCIQFVFNSVLESGEAGRGTEKGGWLGRSGHRMLERADRS